MKIVIDKDGYVISYAIFGDLLNSIEVEAPADSFSFGKNFQAYKYSDGKLVLDEQKLQNLAYDEKIEELRQRREVECFPIVNRGKLWYDSLTPCQISELKDWYDAWLQITETLRVPEKPEWL